MAAHWARAPASMRDDGSSHHYIHYMPPKQEIRVPRRRPPEQLFRVLYKVPTAAPLDFLTIFT